MLPVVSCVVSRARRVVVRDRVLSCGCLPCFFALICVLGCLLAACVSAAPHSLVHCIIRLSDVACRAALHAVRATATPTASAARASACSRRIKWGRGVTR